MVGTTSRLHLHGDSMKRRLFASLGAVLVGIAAVVSLPAMAQTKVVWKASDVHPLGYPTVEAIVRMGKKFETATNGRISIQMYPSMQLGGEKEMIEQAQVGALQIARIVALGWMDAGVRNVYGKKPVPTPADLKGQKIRMMGNPIFVETMNAMGGSGVAMGFNELYAALETGVVDGAENNPPTLLAQNHYLVSKVYTLTGHLIIPEIFIFSKRTWDGLTPDDQALLKKLSREAQFEQRKLWDEKTVTAEADLKAKGVTFVPADKAAFYKATQPIRDKYGVKYAALLKRIEETK